MGLLRRSLKDSLTFEDTKSKQKYLRHGPHLLVVVLRTQAEVLCGTRRLKE